MSINSVIRFVQRLVSILIMSIVVPQANLD